jgi:NAD(P)H-hydrate epimerase
MIDLVSDPNRLPPDAAVNHAIAVRMGIAMQTLDQGSIGAASRRWRRCDALVDAMLGTGFRGEVREPLSSIISRLNTISGPLKVAIDVPSGLDVDSGQCGGVAFEADHTVTFVARKAGYAQPGARRCLGRVHAVDIGAPTAFILRQLGLSRS